MLITKSLDAAAIKDYNDSKSQILYFKNNIKDLIYCFEEMIIDINSKLENSFAMPTEEFISIGALRMYSRKKFHEGIFKGLNVDVAITRAAVETSTHFIEELKDKNAWDDSFKKVLDGICLDFCSKL